MTGFEDREPTSRILVVDDDPVQGAVISGVCGRLGYQAVCVTSYQAAADQIVNGGFGCITIDLSLGDRDGIELLRLIAAEEGAPRVIVISGCEQRILSASVRMAHAAGIVDAIALPKPINLISLREALSLGKCAKTLPGARPTKQDARPIAEDELQRAIDNGEIYPVFQPKIELATGRVVGCEALARWGSPSLGVVGPDLFIPVAERSGLIKVITLLMLRESMRIVRRFHDVDPSFVVAVNLSAALLSDTSIPEEIERMLEDAGVAPRALIIEVTESIAMTDVARAMDVLLRLRIKGVGISIDDFGTGYSSLAALARMPFNELKIDRSFVRHCRVDADMWKVVAASIAIAHQYNMTAVAEGIEDVDTWRALVGLGCDIGQGFEFSPGLTRDAFVDWYQHWSVTAPANPAGKRRAEN